MHWAAWLVGTAAWGWRSSLTRKRRNRGGRALDPLRRDVPHEPAVADTPTELPTSRFVWERIYGRPLSDADVEEIEGNLFRYVDLLASISGSILGARKWSMTSRDEAA